MRTAAGHSSDAPPRTEPAGPSAPTVWRLTAAVHAGLIASLVLLVCLRLLGLHIGIAAESGVVGLILVTALLVARWRGSVDRA